MSSRRKFLGRLAQTGAGLALAPLALARELADRAKVLVNDIHSRLNPTYVKRIAPVTTVEELQEAVRAARRAGQTLSIAGGRHAMGGQQFGSDTVLIDTRPLHRLLHLDSEKGHVEAEAGITWPELIHQLIEAQEGHEEQWGIIQKQTGADHLCLGGALGANAHGRGLKLKPMIADVESFRLIGADGEMRNCSRTENSELFRLAIGGYGLFGVMSSVTLRLMPRIKLERVVQVINIDEFIPAVQRNIEAGFLYGDCQFAIDPGSRDFLKKGVFSCYRPTEDAVSSPEARRRLGSEDWRKLNDLAHTEPAEAFKLYSTHYLSTSGQVYWSDSHQLSTYVDDYHVGVDERTGARWPGTEMITEVYVPRPELGAFLTTLGDDFRRHGARVIYGTIRLIEKDDESFLPWARESYACIVMNLHVSHSPQGIAKATIDFRRIIDRAIQYGGSYFLTYHRWASHRQVDICYPQMGEFLRLKRKHDPKELFQSDWYRHYRRMLV